MDDTMPTLKIDEEDRTHSPISCTNCRKAHRKCDKLLPSCGECRQRDPSACQYNTPKKRGPKLLPNKRKQENTAPLEYTKILVTSTMDEFSANEDLNVQNKTYPMKKNDSFSINDLNTNSTAKIKTDTLQEDSKIPTHIDKSVIMEIQSLSDISQLRFRGHFNHLILMFIDYVSDGQSLFDRQLLDDFYNTTYPYYSPCVTLNGNINVQDELRLLHIECMIIAALQRISCKHLAHQMFENVCRVRIGKYFDKCNIYHDLACCCIILCTYLTAEAEFSQASIYKLLLGSFTLDETVRQNEGRGSILPIKHKLTVFALQWLDMLSSDPVIRMRSVGVLYSNYFFEEAFDDSCLDSSKYQSDLEYASAILDCINMLEQKTKAFYYNNLPALSGPVENLSLNFLHNDLLLNGVRLSILKKIGLISGDLAKKFADRVTELTLSPLFTYCSYLALDSVVSCCMIHMNDYNTKLNVLEYDLLALQSLENRYSATRRLYGGLMNTLEERIKNSS
ncbi:transcriptional regulatory protein [Acrasis kona]|uniref:Transcriptional regulatory protein n=1 Tax=Acrasis kona TaxID=1008807 RepID=A0AAW2YKK2_9EUKA